MGIVAARLERTAAFARAEIAREEGEDLVDVVEETFGTIWVDGESYGFVPAAEAPKIRGRRSTYRALQEAEAEVARLTKEVERLKGQVAKWREEAARWRKSAVEFRREIGSLRKEIGALRKNARENARGGFRSAVRRIPLAQYAKRAVSRKPKS